MTTNYDDIATAAALSAAISSIDQASQAGAGPGVNYSITLQSGVTLVETAALAAIDLRSADTLTIDGAGDTLSGVGVYRGLFDYAGTVTIENLTLANMLAQGAAGGSGPLGGGGGGAGLGGGLYVGSNVAGDAGNVTLANVAFSNDYARGGSAGFYSPLLAGGAGGGMKLASMNLGGDYGGYGQGGGLGQSGGFGGGGGGGDGQSDGFGGDGGFGGGGGGDILYGGGGVGGFGGGAGGGGQSGGGGGGGLGAGGDIFVQSGATLTIDGGVLSGGGVWGGAGYGASMGSAFGSGIFLQSNDNLVFAPTLTAPVAIYDVIADQTGSGGTGANAGAGSLTLDGPGVLMLNAQNTFTGGVTLDQGTLEIGAGGSAGSGAITFASPSATLQIDASLGNNATFASILSNLVGGDAIDLRGLAFTAGATATLSGSTLAVVSNGVTNDLTLNASEAASYSVASDGQNGTEIIATGFNANALGAEIAAIDAASQASTGPGVNYSITLTGGMTLVEIEALPEIDLRSGDTLTIDGAGDTLSGDDAFRGLFVYAGNVTIENLTLSDMLAQGDAGSSTNWGGGGGGAGLGGGLFVGSNVAGDAGNVTLANVAFSGDTAVGGAAGWIAAPNASTDRLAAGGGMNLVGDYGNYGVGAGATPAVAGFGGGGSFSGSVGGSYASLAGFGGGGAGGLLYGEGSGGGAGGFGGGQGGVNYGGGGGLGAGGDIFVQSGATLTIEGGVLSGGAVSGGAVSAYSGNGKGSAYGAGIFLQGNENINFAPTLTAPVIISDVIADQTGSGGTGANAGGGSLTLDGLGVLTLNAQNTFSGGVTLDEGTLQIGALGSAGSGAITFAGPAATLQIDASLGNNATFSNVISGFFIGDAIDLRGLAFAAGATASLSGSTLAVVSNGVTNNLTLTAANSQTFSVASDGNNGTELLAADSNANALSAEIAAIDAESQASTGPGVNYSITLTSGMTLVETAALPEIDLRSGDTLTIDGGGDTLSGVGDFRGLFVYAGKVTIENLTLVNMLAQGGAGASGDGSSGGGGGGAGLGGGLYVGSNVAGDAGDVTLANVAFSGDAAVGGAGASGGAYPSGNSAGGGLNLDGDYGSYGRGGAFSNGYYAGFGGGGMGGLSGGGGSGGFGGGGGGRGSGAARYAPGDGGGSSIGFGGADGGFGGGGGNGGAGGGGLGAGGDIFVQSGATLTIQGGLLSGGAVAGGAGGGGVAPNGSAYGSGIFLQGNENINFAPTLTAPVIISDVIADQTGSGGTGANAGAGSLTLDGPGVLTLNAQNTFSGGVTLDEGTLEIGASGSAGSGAITFAGPSATLQIDASLANNANFANVISGFAAGDTIDLRGLSFRNTATVTLTGSALAIVSHGVTNVLTLNAPGAVTYSLANDGYNGTEVIATPSSLAIGSDGGLTTLATQTISGAINAADAGATVSIYDGATLLGATTANGSGVWSTAVTLLSTQGVQEITAQATDAAGNLETSAPVTYLYWNGKPTGLVSVSVANYEAYQPSLDSVAGGFSVVDSAANISASLGELNDPHLDAITISDDGAVASSVAQLTSYAATLAKLHNANGSPYQLAITDTAADVAANLDALQANAHIAWIALTDAAAPVLTLSLEQALNDTVALGEIVTAFSTTISDTGGNIAALTATQTAALEADGYTTIAATTAVTISASQALAFEADGIAVTAPTSASVTLSDQAYLIGKLTPTQIAGLVVAGVTAVKSSASVLFSVADAEALENSGLKVTVPSGDYARINDTAANIDALTAAQIEALPSIGLTSVFSTDTGMTLGLAQLQAYQAAGVTISMASGALSNTLSDTAATIDGLSVAEIDSLPGRRITRIIADGGVTLDAAQALALESFNVGVSVPAGDSVTLSDSSAAIEALTKTQIAALSGTGVTTVVAGGPLVLNVAQAVAFETAGMSLQAPAGGVVSDLAWSLEQLTAAEMAGMAALGVSEIITTNSSINYTVAQTSALVGSGIHVETAGATTATENFANGDYSAYGNGELIAQKCVNADGSYNIANMDISGQPYVSDEAIYNGAGVEVAFATNKSAGSGSLTVYASGATVSVDPSQLSLSSQGDTFNLNAHAAESLTASGSTQDSFVFTPASGAGATCWTNSLSGFTASGSSHDTLTFSAAAFGATIGQGGAADLAALLSHTVESAVGAVITDIYGDSLALNYVTKTTLSSAAATSAFKFV